MQACVLFSHSFTHLMTRTNGNDSLVLVVGGSNQHLTVSIPPRPVLSEGEQVLHATTRLLELISSSVYFTVYFLPPPRMNQECRVGSHGQTKSDCTVLHLWKRFRGVYRELATKIIGFKFTVWYMEPRPQTPFECPNSMNRLHFICVHQDWNKDELLQSQAAWECSLECCQRQVTSLPLNCVPL